MARLQRVAVEMVQNGGREAARRLILETISTLRAAGYEFGITVRASTGTMFVFLGTKDNPDKYDVILEGNRGDFQELVNKYLAGWN